MYSEGGPEMAQDIAGMYSVVNEILGFVRGAGQEMEIGEVERRVLSMVMEVGRKGAHRISGIQGKWVSGSRACQCPGRSSFIRARQKLCVPVGPLGGSSSNEPITSQRDTTVCFPLDEMLNLPDRGYSYLVQEIASKLSMNASYEKGL